MNQAVFSPPAPQQAMNLFAQTTGFGYDEMVLAPAGTAERKLS